MLVVNGEPECWLLHRLPLNCSSITCLSVQLCHKIHDNDDDDADGDGDSCRHSDNNDTIHQMKTNTIYFTAYHEFGICTMTTFCWYGMMATVSASLTTPSTHVKQGEVSLMHYTKMSRRHVIRSRGFPGASIPIPAGCSLRPVKNREGGFQVLLRVIWTCSVGDILCLCRMPHASVSHRFRLVKADWQSDVRVLLSLI